MDKNPIWVITNFIKALEIPVTHTSVLQELEKHPHPDSLLAISELFDNWKIPNASYRILAEQVGELPLPFIAHFKNKEFVIVYEFDSNKVVVSNDHWRKHSLPRKEFDQSFAGPVFVAENSAESGEEGYAKKRRDEMLTMLRNPFLSFIAFFFLMVVVFGLTDYHLKVNFIDISLLLVKMVGLGVTILLLAQNIDSSNVLVQRVCGAVKNSGCNDILSSDAAKLTGWLSWSEVGFFYFAGTWLILLFQGGHFQTMQLLALINLCCLPYTIYSFWYQFRVAKKLCILCTITQVVLWLEFTLLFSKLRLELQVHSVKEFISCIICLIFPVLSWAVLKPILTRVNKNRELSIALQKFKTDKSIFEQLLGREGTVNLLSDEQSLIIGNKDANKTLTMVSNPFCIPCLHTHRKLDSFIKNRDDVKLQILFTTGYDDADPRTKVASQIMAISREQGSTRAKAALKEWYQSSFNYETWVERNPAVNYLAGKVIIDKQNSWCNIADITATPTLFLDGKRISRYYSVDDLTYII